MAEAFPLRFLFNAKLSLAQRSLHNTLLQLFTVETVWNHPRLALGRHTFTWAAGAELHPRLPLSCVCTGSAGPETTALDPVPAPGYSPVERQDQRATPTETSCSRCTETKQKKLSNTVYKLCSIYKRKKMESRHFAVIAFFLLLKTWLLLMWSYKFITS